MADSEGQASIRGSAGDGELTITRGRVVHRFEAEITERSVDTITLTIDPQTNPPARRPRGGEAPTPEVARDLQLRLKPASRNPVWRAGV